MATFFENHRVKIFALIMASLFWFAVATENDYNYESEVPIYFTNLPEHKIIVGDVPAKATVRFSGKGKSLLALLFYREVFIELDLSHVRSGVDLELTPAMVQMGRRGIPVAATQILSPHSISIKLGSLRKKIVPIRPVLSLKMPPGFTLASEVQLEPDSIEIAGPEAFVKALREIKTVPREFDNLRSGLQEELALQAFPDSIKIEMPFKSVQLTLDVQKLIELNLPEIPVRVKNVPAHLKVTAVPSTMTLTVEGGERLLMRLKRDDISAYIDYARIRPSDLAGHPVSIEAPPGVRYRNPRPGLFKLIMERNHNGSARR